MKKYILLLFLGITITVNAQVCLDVPVIIKEQTEWCWVGASKCVLDYYGFVHRQCEIAEYVRHYGIFYNLGSVNCCDDPSQGCNHGTSSTGGTGSIEDILVEFGNIANAPANALDISGIEFHLNQRRPLIMIWESLFDPTHMHTHAMVIYGTNGYEVEFMDPDEGYKDLPYNELLNNGVFQWKLTIFPLVSPFIIPEHCKNCIFDADKGETAIDCGGPCPPCVHAPDRVIINTPTDNLPADVYAIENITAGNASIRVLSGQNVNFYTTGSIDLLPGFEVQGGGTFNAAPKGNIFEVTADCNAFCRPIIYDFYIRWYEDFTVDVANVSKIVAAFYYYDGWAHTDHNGELVYKTTVTNVEGRVALWDLITGDFSFNLQHDNDYHQYIYSIDFYPCQGGRINRWDFMLIRNPPPNKSLSGTSEPEETETPTPFLSPNLSPNPSPEAPPSFSILPNPNIGSFQLETNFPLSEIGNLKIMNLLGVSVYETQTLVSNTIQLNNASAGQHFVVIILKDGTVLTQKMMVQR